MQQELDALRTLTDWLFESDLDRSEQSELLLHLGMAATTIRLPRDWLSRAPAHPAKLAGWTLQQFGTVPRTRQGHSDGAVKVDLTKLARFSPLFVSLTRPHDWQHPVSRRSRLRVDFARSSMKLLQPGAPWFELLCRTSDGGAGICRMPAEPRQESAAAGAQDASWHWPLTIAVRDEAPGRPLASALQSASSDSVLELVPFRPAQKAGILFVNADVDALPGLLSSVQPGQYAYIVAAGEVQDIRELRNACKRFRSAGVVALHLPRDDGGAYAHWAGGFCARLAENRTLDQALALSEGGAPVLYAHSELLDATSIGAAVRDFGQRLFWNERVLELHLERDFPSLGIRAQHFSTNALIDVFVTDLAGRKRWSNREVRELVGFMDIARSDSARRSDSVDSAQEAVPIPDALTIHTARQDTMSGGARSGRSLVDVEDDIPFGAGLPPAVPVETRAQEHHLARQARLQAELWDDHERLPHLQPGQRASVRVWIGRDNTTLGASAGAPFPSQLLPPEPASHVLELVYVPLMGTPHAMRGKAQVRTARFSMSRGEADTVEFAVDAAAETGEYRARILVMFENRVLQSLLYRVDIAAGEEAGRGASIDVENMVKPDLSHLAYGRGFDMAMVLNHNQENVQGALVVSNGAVNFKTVEGGFAHSLASIKKLCWELNEASSPDGTVNAASFAKTLYALAHHGSIMREALLESDERLQRFASAAAFDPENPLRLQVVEARPGSFMPVEFFYDFAPPLAGAPLCAKIDKGEFPRDTCIGCQDRGGEHVICPIGFWGVSRVIERRPADQSLGGADYQWSEPSAERRKLPRLNRALLGVSKKVHATDVGTIEARLDRGGLDTVRASCWSSWQAAVQDTTPSLLMAIAHTDTIHTLVHLEIEDAMLALAHIRQPYVTNNSAHMPVVLLLGCQTRVSPDPLQSIAPYFKRHGAALVVCSLANIFGAQTPACVDALLTAFKEASQRRSRADATVGIAMLKAKQRLLARGHSVGLALTAIGDAEWQF